MPTQTTDRRRQSQKPQQQGGQRDYAMSRNPEGTQDFQAMTEGVCDAIQEYGMRHPLTAATAIFFFGFYIGWKVKPW